MHEQDRESDIASLERQDLSTADLAGRSAEPERSQGDHEPSAASAAPSSEGSAAPLFPGQESAELRERWHAIQAGFVDEPRRAVEQADGLVAAAMKRLAEVFASEREGLESQWDRGDDVSTEDLRVALRRYRSFFDRLLSM